MLLLLLYLFKSCLIQDFCNSCKLLFLVVIYFVNVFSWEILHQGPVVESITSLKMLLVKDSLSLLLYIKSSALIFFAEKVQKFVTIFWVGFLHIIFLRSC